MNVQQFPAETWLDSGRLHVLNTTAQAKDLWKEVTIIFITPVIVWSQVKQQGGNTALPIDRNLDQRFIEHGPAHQNKIQLPSQSVSPSRKLP